MIRNQCFRFIPGIHRTRKRITRSCSFRMTQKQVKTPWAFQHGQKTSQPWILKKILPCNNSLRLRVIEIFLHNQILGLCRHRNLQTTFTYQVFNQKWLLELILYFIQKMQINTGGIFTKTHRADDSASFVPLIRDLEEIMSIWIKQRIQTPEKNALRH